MLPILPQKNQTPPDGPYEAHEGQTSEKGIVEHGSILASFRCFQNLSATPDLPFVAGREVGAPSTQRLLASFSGQVHTPTRPKRWVILTCGCSEGVTNCIPANLFDVQTRTSPWLRGDCRGALDGRPGFFSHLVLFAEQRFDRWRDQLAYVFETLISVVRFHEQTIAYGNQKCLSAVGGIYQEQHPEKLRA